jgi:hypothetical protein
VPFMRRTGGRPRKWSLRSICVRSVEPDRRLRAIAVTAALALLLAAGYPSTAPGSRSRSAPRTVSRAGRSPRSLDPRLDIRLLGQTGPSGFPAVLASFTPSAAQPNLRAATIVLPPGELLALSHLRSVCDAASFASDSCPAAAAHGSITTWTTLSPTPLRAPVYLLQSAGRLPSLAAHLGS